MPKQIDKLMRISDLGYVDRFEDIEQILENFLNYTVEDILYTAPPVYQIQVSANNIIQFMGNIEHHHENVGYTNSLTISDLICTMRYFLDNSANSHTTLLSYMKGFRNNIYSLNLPWAELFFAIRLDRLIEYFDNKFNTNSYSIFYKTICYMTKRYTLYEINNFTTIGTLFSETFAYMFADWTPGYDIDLGKYSVNSLSGMLSSSHILYASHIVQAALAVIFLLNVVGLTAIAAASSSCFLSATIIAVRNLTYGFISFSPF